MGMEAMLIMWLWPFEQITDPHIVRMLQMNLIEIGPDVSEEKSFENVDKHSIRVTLGQGHWTTLAYGIHRGAWSPFFHIKEYH